MFTNVFSKFLDVNKKELDKLQKTVDEINKLSSDCKKLKDSDFPRKTLEFKNRLDKGESLESIVVEGMALAREASLRRIGLYPYDVQMMAAVALFQGKIIEQKTGEGKTLAAVPALYLRALAGKGVHLVTVNDYLARRDAGWNAPAFHLLGQSVGVIVQEGKSLIFDINFIDKTHGDERLQHLKPCGRKEAYAADITYGTNNEFGFDYLRDNMVQSLEDKVQRGHYYAVVDEVDSVLIDEARTPLIISAPDTEPTEKYVQFAGMVDKLKPDVDYLVDEKTRSASLTEQGITKVEKLMGVDNLYENDYTTIHHIENALRAKSLYRLDKEYVIQEGQVVIVDEFTGRLMPGRRWNDGMHQAVEAKEKVHIQQESKTLATISFQNYFRMYEVLSGMTGTAATEAEEFRKIYNRDVVVVPTNEPVAREDMSDLVYKTLKAKHQAIVEEIEMKRKIGQPVLVGTTSIEKNEIISLYLKRKKIDHNVLNAKNHEKEALIISGAGKPGAITVATNMAGRGVDIVLGGSKPERQDNQNESVYKESKAYKKWKQDHEKVIKAGGLHVIGTERHESRRIDNQLRGRSGRQGDPGSTRFYLSLEDDLMRVFGGDQIRSLMDRLKLPDDQPIENKLISRAIEQAQVKVEGSHFDTRKNVVEYDDVANQQRDIVYKLRNKILESENIKDEIYEKLEKQIEKIIVLSSSSGKFDSEKAVVNLLDIIPFDEASRDRVKMELEKRKSDNDRKELIMKVVSDVYSSREKQVSDKVMRQIEKYSYLSSIDHLWIEHIDFIDGLRTAVGLRGAAQRDPKAEFKNEAFSAFEGLIDRIDAELTNRLFRTQVTSRFQSEIPLEMARTNVDASDNTGLSGDADFTALAGKPAFRPSSSKQIQNALANKSHENKKVSSKAPGRNDPCPCGAINPNTGKPYKYKKCGLINAPYHNL
ncbi:preprotein translocase subunit SecA [Candidatus Woesebacteria bacterium]|nr:MAG: preprotein translocase subunit SecA [Candidatus Woesebacteria bacterium]